MINWFSKSPNLKEKGMLWRAGCSLKTEMNVLIYSTPDPNNLKKDNFHLLIGKIGEDLKEVKILSEVSLYPDGGTVSAKTAMGDLYIPTAVGHNKQYLLENNILGVFGNVPIRPLSAREFSNIAVKNINGKFSLELKEVSIENSSNEDFSNEDPETGFIFK